jgi:hypothetical protein
MIIQHSNQFIFMPISHNHHSHSSKIEEAVLFVGTPISGEHIYVLNLDYNLNEPIVFKQTRGISNIQNIFHQATINII